MSDNKQTVIDFYNLAFVQKQPALAAQQFFGPEGYKQHNPAAPDGAEAFPTAIGGMLEAFPGLSTDLKRVVAEDDLVVLHYHLRMSKEERGNAVVDIYRVSNGKIVEHWDVVQPVPEEPANDNTMF